MSAEKSPRKSSWSPRGRGSALNGPPSPDWDVLDEGEPTALKSLWGFFLIVALVGVFYLFWVAVFALWGSL